MADQTNVDAKAAADKYEQAGKLQIDEKYKQYLTLRAQLMRKEGAHLAALKELPSARKDTSLKGKTLRDKQAELKAKGLPWEIAKSFDGAAVIAPFVVGSTFADVTDIGIRLTINGEVRQDGNSKDMLNPIVPMIQYMAGCFSLQAGDVILTGTPVGVGPLNVGDELVLELPGASSFTGSVR